jgi:hypothetical protein
MWCGRVVAVAGRVVVLLVVVMVVPACAPRARTRVAARPLPAWSEWPRPEVLDAAMRAWDCGRQEGEFDSGLLTVVDYSLPSTERRLWVIYVPTH